MAKMELSEAIHHLECSLEDQSKVWCDECKNEHRQLLEWLVELQSRREQDAQNRADG